MYRKFLVVFGCAALIFSAGACKKKEEQKPLTQPQAQPGIVMTGPSKVVIPDAVKGKWDAVKIAIEDKKANKTEDVTIKLNGEYAIKGSNLKIKVGDFLPDFKMDGGTISSASDKPNNPAVQVMIYEGDKEIFKGWLYSKFPAIHPFQHEKYGLTLKEALKKG
jgi:hypothetical protein